VLPAAAAGLLGPLLSAAFTATGAAVLAVNSLRLRRYGTTRGYGMTASPPERSGGR
jgi:hypothetical protein